MKRKLAAISVASLVAGALLAIVPAEATAHVSNVTVPSRAADQLGIRISVYKPASASSTHKVPVILHSHGWGGSRTSNETGFAAWLAEDFGVVSIDQRGHGQTGGIAHVQNPEYEAQDIMAVIDYVATLDWVALDRDANNQQIAGDPVMGAIGGSYGGGYQIMTALREIQETGRTRFNALAPEITWNNLPRSLAPADVPRTLWNSALYAAGVQRLPDYVHQSFAVGTATATFPNGEIPGVYNLKERFYRNSPAWYAANGYNLDIPVAFRQGISDNLFILNEAIHNYDVVLTPGARAKSLIVGYNGGHNIPSVVPVGTNFEAPLVQGGDGCSGPGGFEAVARSFFKKVFAGQDPTTVQSHRYNLTSTAGACIRTNTLDSYTQVALNPGIVATPTAGSPALQFEVARGPITVAGIPRLTGTFSAIGVDARAFFGLSLGATPATAQLIQNNVIPMRQRDPVMDQPLDLELAGVAVTVPEGQSLYLTVTSLSDMFLGAARTPGVFVISGATVHLPLAQ